MHIEDLNEHLMTGPTNTSKVKGFIERRETKMLHQLREAAKIKVLFLVAWPLRRGGGGGKGRATKKKTVFECYLTNEKKVPLTTKLEGVG